MPESEFCALHIKNPKLHAALMPDLLDKSVPMLCHGLPGEVQAWFSSARRDLLRDCPDVIYGKKPADRISLHGQRAQVTLMSHRSRLTQAR